MTVLRFKRGAELTAADRLQVGEPIHNPDTGALGIGTGEQQPRWYPGINPDGDMVLREGQRIVSSDNPDTSIAFINGRFTVTINGQEAFAISEDNETILENVTLSDTLKFGTFRTTNFETDPGFAFEDGVFKITAPLEILGPLNLSLQEFASTIIPTDYQPGDVFKAGDGNAESHNWANPATLLTDLNLFAPLLYRAAINNGRTLDLKFSATPSYYGVNLNNKGSLDNNLWNFLSKFDAQFFRYSSGGYFNRRGLYTVAGTSEPRIEYDPYSGTCLGLLIESASQNNIATSSLMNNWSTTNVSLVNTNRLEWSLKGLSNPYSLSESGAGEHFATLATFNVPKNKVTAFSTFVELPAIEATLRIQLQLADLVNSATAKFTLSNSNATVSQTLQTGSGLVIDTFIQRISSTIYRVGIVGIMDSNSPTPQTLSAKIFALDGANASSYTGNRAGLAFVGDTQIEFNDRVSSYIKTTGSTRTRASDNFILNLSNQFSYDQYKNFIGFKFRSNKIKENDPIFTLFSNNYKAALRGAAGSAVAIDQGLSGSVITTSIGQVSDFVNYAFDCTSASPDAVTLNIGANQDSTKYFNGWFNLIYIEKQ